MESDVSLKVNKLIEEYEAFLDNLQFERDTLGVKLNKQKAYFNGFQDGKEVAYLSIICYLKTLAEETKTLRLKEE